MSRQLNTLLKMLGSTHPLPCCGDDSGGGRWRDPGKESYYREAREREEGETPMLLRGLAMAVRIELWLDQGVDRSPLFSDACLRGFPSNGNNIGTCIDIQALFV